MKAVLLNGSPAKPARVRAGLDYMAGLFTEHGHEAEVLDLGDMDLPVNDPANHYDPLQSPSEDVRTLAQKVAEAGVVVLGTPLYHGSYSGLLKYALDHLEGAAFDSKKIIILSNASGPRMAMQGAQELVVVARTMGGDVHGRLIGTCKSDYEERDGHNVLTDEAIQKRCQEIVQDVS